MSDARPSTDRTASEERPPLVNYLPAMPDLSAAPGSTLRVLTRLFRRRGELPAGRRRD